MIRTFAACAFACLPISGQAEETRITIDTGLGQIVGTLETPPGDPAPVVLLLHGFSGSRDELPIEGTDGEGVFARTARHLADAGYASLRIDFRGSGESDGAWEETTFSGQIADGWAAARWLVDSDLVDGERLAVLGWSQGGLIASHLAFQPDTVDSLILWAPVTMPAANFVNIFGADTLFEAIAAEADEAVTLTLPWGVDTTLNGAFFDEMLTTSTPAALARYTGPVQIVMGSNDTTILPQPGAGEMLDDYHVGTSEVHLLEMDHVFNVFTGPRPWTSR